MHCSIIKIKLFIFINLIYSLPHKNYIIGCNTISKLITQIFDHKTIFVLRKDGICCLFINKLELKKNVFI